MNQPSPDIGELDDATAAALAGRNALAFSELVSGSLRWWTHLMWLGYLCFPLLEVLRQPRPFWYYISVIVAMGLFLVAYGLVLQRPGPLGNAAATLLSLAIAILWHRIFGVSAVVFLLYAGLFAGFQASLRQSLLLIAVLELFLLAQWWLGHTPAPPLVALGLATLGIGVGSTYIHRWLLADRLSRLARTQIERLAQSAERDRIARDLHDLLGHSLSLVVLKAELARRLAPTHPEAMVAEIADIERAARDALTQVRAAVRGYRGEGLARDAERMQDVLVRAGIDCQVETGPVLLAPTAERVLSLALREAVTNILRHSRARRAWIELAASGDFVRLSVRDDGIGLKGASEGSGLKGMQERLGSIGGHLRLDENGPGASLVAEVPALKDAACRREEARET